MLAEQAFGSSRAPVTRVILVWRLFHFLNGLSARMDQLPCLEEGLRLQGVAWLERRLSSFNKEALIAIAASLNIFLPEGCRKNDITNTLLTKFQCAEDIFELQRRVVEGGPARLREKLAKFGMLELKRMAEHIGVSSSDSKEELITKLSNHVSSQDGVLVLHQCCGSRFVMVYTLKKLPCICSVQ